VIYPDRVNLLDFIFVGPQRTASSWLDRALRSHPEIELPSLTKETFYFDTNFERGPAWYQGHFPSASHRCLRGEIGPTYFHNDVARRRISERAPTVKVIIGIRDPIERTFSLLRHEHAKGRIDDLETGLEAEPWIAESGRYAEHIPAWEATFGTERILYFWQSDTADDPERAYAEVCDFLGVAEHALPADSAEKFGVGMVPRFRAAARVAAFSARRLRALGLHRVVELGKKAGLRKVYNGGDPAEAMLSESLADKLRAVHAEDVEFLEAKFGRPLHRSSA
jgi:hypothetical protein